MSDLENLRVRLQYRLIELGISKSELCRKIGRRPQWLSDILTGHGGLTEEGIRQLCQALDVPDSFFGPEISQSLRGSEKPVEAPEAVAPSGKP